MDPLREDVKKTMDDSYFRELELDEAKKRLFISQIKSAPIGHGKKPTPFKAAFAGIGALALIVLLSFTFLGFGAQQDTAAPAQKEVDNIFGHEVTIPQFKKYPITFMAVYLPKKFGHKELSVNYAATKGELDKNMTKEAKQKWEESNESRLLYGPFTTSRPILRLSFNETKPVLDKAEIKKVNGFEVQYNLLLDRPAGDFYIAIINTESGSYHLEMFLNKSFTIRDADNLIKDLTRQLKEKRQTP